jgi:hypothetical protein
MSAILILKRSKIDSCKREEVFVLLSKRKRESDANVLITKDK